MARGFFNPLGMTHDDDGQLSETSSFCPRERILVRRARTPRAIYAMDAHAMPERHGRARAASAR